jgi:hypothetical protein
MHEIWCEWIPASNSDGNPTGSNFGCRFRRSGADGAVGTCDATLLLPLRLRDRHETLHEDVRTAEISKPFVGNLLPQEELDRE